MSATILVTPQVEIINTTVTDENDAAVQVTVASSSTIIGTPSAQTISVTVEAGAVYSGPGGGAVSSVDGRTGDVTLGDLYAPFTSTDSRLDALEASSTSALFEPAVRILPIAGGMDVQLQQTDNALMAGHCIYSYEYNGVWYQLRLFVGWASSQSDWSINRHAFIVKRTLPDGAWSAPVDLAQGGGNERSDPFVMQYADPNLGRTVTDGVTANGSATITSNNANFTTNDVGALVVGSADLPPNVRIKTFVDEATVVLEAPCTGGHSGQTFTILTGAATHPAVALGVSKDGYIHVMGNVHNDPLNYVRSTNPSDISAWTDHTSTSGNPILAGNWLPESSASYPKFCRQGTGSDDLFMFFRDTNGGMTTNDSKWWVYRWNATTHIWENPMGSGIAFVNGHDATPVRGPYIQHPFADSQGRIHVFWENKYDTVATTGYENDDLYYARIEADGTTLKKADGSTISKPMLSNTGDLVFDTPNGTDVGLGQYHLTIDSADEPHTLIHYGADGGSAQLKHFYHDVTGWHVGDLLQSLSPLWNFTGATQCAPYAIGDRIYAFMNKNGIRAVDITPGDTNYGKLSFPVVDLDLNAWMHGIDPTALRQRNILALGVNEVRGLASGTNAAENVRQCLNAVIEFDTRQFNQVAQRSVRVPSIRSVETANFPRYDAEIRGTTSAGTSWRGCQVGPTLQGDGVLWFFTFGIEGRVSVTGTTLVVELWEQGASVPRAKLYIADSTTNVARQLTWTPLVYLGASHTGSLEVRAYVSGSGYGLIDAGKIQVQVGILDEQLQGKGY